MQPTSRAAARAAVTVACALLALSACSSSGPAPAPHHAAEPAVSPPLRQAPAGTVVDVGRLPQGIAFDASTSTLAVAVRDPARLLLLDPATLAVRRTVPLPGTVRHLQIGSGGGSVLVPVETADELVQIELPGGGATSTKVGVSPHDAAQTPDGDIEVGDERGRALSVVRSGRVVHTFGDLTQPGGVIADGTTVGVVDVGAYTLSTYDLTTLRRTARVPAGAGPTHGVLLTGNRFLVVDTRGNRVLEYSVRPLEQIGTLPLPGSPYGVTSDEESGTVWVTLTGRNEVVGLDVGSSTPRVIVRYPTVRQPDTVAAAPGSRSVWVAGAADGDVEEIRR